ncbi:dihydrofolate reductase [Homoserinimonas aerilata]|uniref:Dihydrofolate reductase n=1 Tax=Homoserinimonas aerilata TaxID=1162970 RepID=A0A542YJ33_9MICO|nr:dihydrofolate reductase family protein [Homoserinimonas aerilata]TQL48082.1 dihydrofolate reductase [Homoserinimonas aerilata]
MPRFIYYTASTLNGFLADEHNSLSWLFAVEHPGSELTEKLLDRVGVMVEGSTTYEWMLREERMLEEPQRWSEFHGERPAFVFTSRKLPVPEGVDVRFASGSVADAVPAIVEAAGERDIWLVGGGELVGQFHDLGLLDEIQVSIAPVTLPGGAPLLPRRIESDALQLRTVEHLGGFAHLTFDVKRP